MLFSAADFSVFGANKHMECVCRRGWGWACGFLRLRGDFLWVWSKHRGGLGQVSRYLGIAVAVL